MLSYTPKLNAWKPDNTQPGDHNNDYKFDELTKLLVQKQDVVNNVIDLRKFCSPVENQGQIGSCVANATVSALEFLQIRDEVAEFKDLSRMFIYYNARLMTREQDKDDGTYIRTAWDTLSSLGTCTEAIWAYDVNKVFVRPSWKSYRDGYKNKIKNYYKINTIGQKRISNIREALLSHHPVVFGMDVDQDYINIKSDGIVIMPKKARINASGHAQLIVGMNDNTRRYIVRNSWGQNWGDGGYAHVPYDYLDASNANDLTVAISWKL